MKVGDIVAVHDGSWTLYSNGHGELAHAWGTLLSGHRWCVLAVGDNLCLPTYQRGDGKWNNVILREEGFPEHILFTRAEHCAPAAPRCDEAEVNPVIVTIPSGANQVFIRVNR